METIAMQSSLLKKYDVPVPRYTSYPTVPCWDQTNFSSDQWNTIVKKSFDESNESNGISLYVHLPFCESLCTYCACTTRITRNHAIEVPYIRALLKEWEQYRQLFGRTPVIRELHLGGGTPTFFSPQNLHWLITYLLDGVHVHDDITFSFEGHPNNTTHEHLQQLFDLGFSRVSFGVQDLDEKVQRTINRIQPYENLKAATDAARAIGYTSVSFDLIYGLPFQTPFTVSDTLDKILTLKPDRLAFYSYAHVPWLRPGQRGYEDTDLPSGALKRHLYEIGRYKLRKAGYSDIGMDHFALRSDALFRAHIEGNLHRNFMGYTTTNTDLLIGLGASAISDSKYGYAQNLKKVEDYLTATTVEGLALFKGHLMTDEDMLIRECILQVSCCGEITGNLLRKVMDGVMQEKFLEMEKEGILYFYDGGIQVTSAGEPFLRNICRVFDKRQDVASGEQMFSRAV